MKTIPLMILLSISVVRTGPVKIDVFSLLTEPIKGERKRRARGRERKKKTHFILERQKTLDLI